MLNTGSILAKIKFKADFAHISCVYVLIYTNV